MALDMIGGPERTGMGLVRSLDRPDARPAKRYLEAVLVFLLVTCGYRLMWSPVLVDDAPRYIMELLADRDFWDLAHLWLQPLGLRIFRAFGNPSDPVPTLTWINTLSIGLALAVFYFTARVACGSRSVALLAVVLGAVSFNFVSLGPTAHIKPMVLPFFAFGLHFAWVWESDLCAGRNGKVHDRRLVYAGAFMGAGTCLLVTAVPVALFAALMMAIRMRLLGIGWARSTQKIALFLFAAGVIGTVGLLTAWLTGRADGTAEGGLVSFLIGGLHTKYEVNQFTSSVASRLARSGFSLAYNFVYLQDVGQYGRAYIDDMLPSLRPYAWAIARDIALAVPVLGMVAATAIAGVRAGVRGRQPTLVALGFTAGGMVYAFLLNLNDPEHWLQLTMPLLLVLAIVVARRPAAVAACAVLAALLAVPNLLVYTWPRVTYPLEKNANELMARLGPFGLHMNYSAYPGNMTTAVLGIPLHRSVRPDIIFEENRFDVQKTLEAIDRALAPAMTAGAPVLVFRVFDESDWRGPVASLTARGFAPELLRRHLRAKYEVSRVGEVAGFEAYMLSSRNVPNAPSGMK